MISRWSVLLLIVAAVSLAGRAQTSPPPAPAKDDYSQEAAVIEEMSTKIAFDNDGNSTREQTTRVGVQTDAGVKQWGLLNFPYQSATQTVEIDYVRVHKADGSTLITPPDNVQDLDSEITRSAPFYSDLREKHVAVKGLGKGDIVEYKAHWHTTKPLIPGQFWLQLSFQHDGIVLAERLEIKVPANRAVKVKGPQATQTVTTEASSRIYAWTYSKLQSAKEPESDEKKQTEAALGRRSPPDVQVSSFQSWDDVGRWYWNLQKERVEPTAAIRAKAAELTKGMADDTAKLRTLYSFVSTQYRYIGIAFGIGRYQPHAADDVLTNNYGDCKDKHTLLASLLQASGITLYPALINSSWKLDPDVPSPAQFDHIIGYLPQAKDKDAAWLDTTIEVAPFGYLVTRLRDKQALVMSGEKSIQLVTTPADPPFPSTTAFKIEGKLSDDGTFEAKVEDTIRGEVEVPIRAAFRQVPQPQWKDLVQQISYELGYSGTVSDVSASTPEAIGEPFHFSYSYNRREYPDWKSDHHFTVPGLPFFMPPVRDDAQYPVWGALPIPDTSVPATVAQFQRKLRELPESNSPDANRLEAEARDEMTKQDLQGAVSSLYRAVAADPKFTRAWVLLGVLLLAQKQVDAGTDAFHKAMVADPAEPAIPKALGFSLMAGSKLAEAVPVWQDYMKAHPDDADGPGNLGNCLLKLQRYSEAAAAYEAAVKIKADSPSLQASLGMAYLRAGERDKAGVAFAKLGDVDREGHYLNDVAYTMANADLQLPLALDYAKKAARAAEEESQKMALPDLKVEDLGKIFKVAAYWDTLGWVNERMSNLDVAERYLQASWKLTQDGTVAGHLCHLYKRIHKTGLAIEMCRLAVYRIPMSEGLAPSEYTTEMDAAQENLNHLVGGAANSKNTVNASDVVIRERTYKLARFLPGTESAEFFILLASDGKSKTFKVGDVKFISGSDKMKLQGKQLKGIDFNVPAPDEVPTHFVRRGILGCYQYTGCSFVLLDPATVHSLN